MSQHLNGHRAPHLEGIFDNSTSCRWSRMEWRKHKRSCGRRRTIRSGRRGFSGEVLHPSKNICTLHTQPYSWTHPHIPHIHGYNQPHVHNINYIFHTHYLWIYPATHCIPICRHVPILGSFYNWISPVPEEAKVTNSYLAQASKTKTTS